MGFTEELSNLVNGSAIKGAFFYSADEISNYQCLASNSDSYQSGNDYVLYQLNSLVRLLARKRDIVSKDLLNSMYEDEELCMIIEWNDHCRKIFIFESEENVSQELVNKVQEIKKIYQKHFYQWRDQ
ncbi:MAG: hypothetical protein GY909_06945 [Oligoflexia bacterium]|nr:hypothetical protein [Oligoflexia bacterium]